MIATILGWILIIMGVLFLLKPQLLKNRLQKKGLKKLKRYMFFVLVSLGGLFIGVAWGIPGIFGKILMVLGIIGILKGFFILKAKAAEKTIEWLRAQPLILFRIGACFYITLGIIILLRR